MFFWHIFLMWCVSIKFFKRQFVAFCVPANFSHLSFQHELILIKFFSWRHGFQVIYRLINLKTVVFSLKYFVNVTNSCQQSSQKVLAFIFICENQKSKTFFNWHQWWKLVWVLDRMNYQVLVKMGTCWTFIRSIWYFPGKMICWLDKKIFVACWT